MANRKRNVNYIKPEDPEFLKIIKRQAGYDDRNRKFDPLENAEEDFVDDTESEEPQVVVLKPGDLTAEEAEVERKRLEKEAEETKADLSQRVIFKPKSKKENDKKEKETSKKKSNQKKQSQLLSFNDEEENDESS
ncbi:uncharacterized protein KIAA1143 homolog [Leguminivora glycinivorella]|uniref:uncharacterized protein KIAA1143 homolog n=1 Tax=Leguminivora glycinivorella TaxID=1035111 RepID=UPI002010B9EF|nr:uncharacterized protein KIAA1143 homolog [Leguminivora glycinivorella]